ncbi:hypothetical protein LY76DRAFT_63848 [Colletotrichum caudatum]|nr:hypothetical protein LY76DRAFT_63848 [Colletotrichum caudatum]
MRATAPRLGARILRPVKIPPRPLPAPRPPASSQATKSGASLLSHGGIAFGTTRTTKRSFATSIRRRGSPTALSTHQGNDVTYNDSAKYIIRQASCGLVDFKWPTVLSFPNSARKHFDAFPLHICSNIDLVGTKSLIVQTLALGLPSVSSVPAC